MRAFSADAGTVVIKRSAGIRTFDQRGFRFRGLEGVARVRLRDPMDRLVTVRAELRNRQTCSPHGFVQRGRLLDHTPDLLTPAPCRRFLQNVFKHADVTTGKGLTHAAHLSRHE